MSLAARIPSPELEPQSPFETPSENPWGWIFASGILSVLVGVLAVAAPFFAAWIATLFVGSFFILSGFLHVFYALESRQWGGLMLKLLTGVIYLCVGLSMWYYPFVSMMVLTGIVGAVMAVEGILKLAVALQLRPIAGWSWMAIGGVAAIVLAGILLAGIPNSAVWFLGLLMGINLIVNGWSKMMFASAVRTHEPIVLNRGDF